MMNTAVSGLRDIISPVRNDHWFYTDRTLRKIHLYWVYIQPLHKDFENGSHKFFVYKTTEIYAIL